MSKLNPSPVRGKIKQEYKVNLRINLKNHSVDNQVFFHKCKPRNSAGIDSDITKLFPGFSKGEIIQFFKIDKELMKWVKASPKNKRLLFEEPLKAIQESGIKMERSLLKKLHKVKKENDKRSPIAPGISIQEIEFSTKKTILSKEFKALKKLNRDG